MPQVPHDYEINFWVGVGDVLHAVRMEQFPNRDIAVVAGANALFEWAKTDPDKSLPAAALEYWEQHRQNPALTFNDVQTDLANQWGIQFSAKQVDNEPPRPQGPFEEVQKQIGEWYWGMLLDLTILISSPSSSAATSSKSPASKPSTRKSRQKRNCETKSNMISLDQRLC